MRSNTTSNKRNSKVNARRGLEQLRFEKLDQRQVMTSYIADGDLVIEGSSGNDHVEVADFGSYVMVTENGATPRAYRRSSITNDRIIFLGNDGNDTFDARETGLRTLGRGGNGNDRLYGGSNRDIFFGNNGRDVLTGNDGNDHLLGGDGVDYLYGGAGDDRLEGQAGDDRIYGNDGRDWLFGGADNDLILGGNHNDYLYGYTGDDHLHGEAGDDRLYGEIGHDKLYGNTGRDFLFGSSGNDELFGHQGNDYLYGGADNDVLHGNSGNDYLAGDSGNDRLLGHAGYDSMYGGSGNDGLFGGIGETHEHNTMYGNSGKDRLLYHTNNPPFSNNDTEDVGITFWDNSGHWTEREIQVVDEAFEELQNRVGGNTWILKDSFSDNALIFQKKSDMGIYSGSNETWWFFGHHRRINIEDWNEYNANANDAAKNVVIHEIAHNWDGSWGEPNAYWDAFNRLHENSSRDNDFARNYGRTNAKEDWATLWEVAMGYTSGPTRPSVLFTQKLNIVNSFLNQHPSWRPGWNRPSVGEA